jgi:hypothetical protein
MRAVAHFFAVEQHWCIVFFAFTNDNDTRHWNSGENGAHCVNCCAVGANFVATPNPTRRRHCG